MNQLYCPSRFVDLRALCLLTSVGARTFYCGMAIKSLCVRIIRNRRGRILRASRNSEKVIHHNGVLKRECKFNLGNCFQANKTSCSPIRLFLVRIHIPDKQYKI